MGLLEFLGVLRRHAALFLLVLGLSVGVAFYVVQITPPEYESRAVVLLVDPTQADRDEPANPYLHLGDSLSTTAGLLKDRLSGSATRSALTATNASGTLEVVWDSLIRSPIIRILVRDTDPVAAEASLDILLEEVTAFLDREQESARIPPEDRIRAQVITRSPVAAGSGSRMRGLAAFIAVGLGSATWLSISRDRPQQWTFQGTGEEPGGSAPAPSVDA